MFGFDPYPVSSEPLPGTEPLQPKKRRKPVARKRPAPSQSLSLAPQEQPRDRRGRFARVGAWMKKTRRKVRKVRRLLVPSTYVKARRRAQRRFVEQTYGPVPRKRRRRRK